MCKEVGLRPIRLPRRNLHMRAAEAPAAVRVLLTYLPIRPRTVAATTAKHNIHIGTLDGGERSRECRFGSILSRPGTRRSAINAAMPITTKFAHGDERNPCFS
jgi:hypothetical protein